MSGSTRSGNALNDENEVTGQLQPKKVTSDGKPYWTLDAAPV
jgi:hypothetical protein